MNKKIQRKKENENSSNTEENPTETSPENTEETPQETYQQVIEPKEQDTFWGEDEITPVGFYKDINDERPEPKYVIHYKQRVK